MFTCHAEVHTMPLAAAFILALPLLMVSTAVSAQDATANVARLVVWQPRPGMERDFIEGYKRHLQWHRRNQDPWIWHGWTVTFGDRYGYFVDGTFFRTWAELDTPVSPADDAADNAVNVIPYADVRSSTVYEMVSPVKHFPAAHLSSALMTFVRIEIAPAREADFESLILAETAQAAGESTNAYAILRPANGATDYLLLIPARTMSDLAAHSRFVARLLRAVHGGKGESPVRRFHTETARYRSDMSYVPGN
jgi:hypothetical protein